MSAMHATTVVLLSGGIDSASVLAYYMNAQDEERRKISTLFFDYGQPALGSELAAAQSIARHYGVSLQLEHLPCKLAMRRGEYLARNALFALSATAPMGWRQVVIAMGIHAGTYYDTTPAFIADLQRILDGYTSGSALLVAPFVTRTKADIVQWAKDHHVPLHLTYSCQRRNLRPCGRCLSCQERRALLAA